jgi:hypothetical protein
VIESSCNPTAPDRVAKYFQYRLWILLAAITTCGLYLGWYCRSLERQRTAVNWIRSHGGDVKYSHELHNSGDTEFDGFPIVKEMATPPGPAWWRSLFGIDSVSSVSSVSVDWSEHLHYHDEADELARVLQSLPDVEFVRIRNVGIRDLKFLENHERLRWLDVSNNPITDLDRLGEKRALTTLIIDSTEVSDLSPTNKMRNLANVWFRFTKISDVTPLSQLEKLSSIFHKNSLVSDDEIRNLKIRFPKCVCWGLPFKDMAIPQEKRSTASLIYDGSSPE